MHVEHTLRVHCIALSVLTTDIIETIEPDILDRPCWIAFADEGSLLPLTSPGGEDVHLPRRRWPLLFLRYCTIVGFGHSGDQDHFIVRRHGRIEREVCSSVTCSYTCTSGKNRPALGRRIAHAHLRLAVVGGVEKETVAVIQDQPPVVVLGQEELAVNPWVRRRRAAGRGRWAAKEVRAAVVDVVDDDAVDLVRKKRLVREPPVAATSGCRRADVPGRDQPQCPSPSPLMDHGCAEPAMHVRVN